MTKLFFVVALVISSCVYAENTTFITNEEELKEAIKEIEHDHRRTLYVYNYIYHNCDKIEKPEIIKQLLKNQKQRLRVLYLRDKKEKYYGDQQELLKKICIASCCVFSIAFSVALDSHISSNSVPISMISAFTAIVTGIGIWAIEDHNNKHQGDRWDYYEFIDAILVLF